MCRGRMAMTRLACKFGAGVGHERALVPSELRRPRKGCRKTWPVRVASGGSIYSTVESEMKGCPDTAVACK